MTLKQDHDSDRQELIRQEELARVREQAAEIAEIVARLPADRAQVPASEARAELLQVCGQTAAQGAECLESVELVARTVRVFHSREAFFVRGTYVPSMAEVYEIAAEEFHAAIARRWLQP